MLPLHMALPLLCSKKCFVKQLEYNGWSTYFTCHLGVTSACAFENKAGEPVPLTLLDNDYDTVDKGISCTNLGNEANDGASVDFEVI